ncbi:heme NO-binding domain-containing protein [Pseudooceanicola sp.]|uniref:heme NO-binding domain-containing protein n=1 Tax=Pseudooceanicola sp. TaxID=1914328 RepID=UPI00262FA257|nr:heme NO-binding domain-containing protein [Pseudooceanicola sp.]MDF1854853.1 heme NO-binding domain-containing protein [Pseudooceanicola sp.]
MHGLINRALQRFTSDTYGTAFWGRVVESAGLGLTHFEPMMTYKPEITQQLIDALARGLKRPRATVLEDVGIYLVSHSGSDAVRRLLRFCGASYEEFLFSLDELPDRARLAVADLDLPQLDLRQTGPDRFTLTCLSPHPGFGHVLVGILQAMADDYGALVTLAHHDGVAGRERIDIALVVASYAAGRQFDLGARTG